MHPLTTKIDTRIHRTKILQAFTNLFVKAGVEAYLMTGPNAACIWFKGAKTLTITLLNGHNDTLIVIFQSPNKLRQTSQLFKTDQWFEMLDYVRQVIDLFVSLQLEPAGPFDKPVKSQK
jgi:hypothetical protein